jgi:hypothetical protein
MSARQSPVERDARKIAVRDLHLTREYRHDKSARELLDTSAADLAREAARALLRGDIPEARRYARAHQLLSESARRLTDRHEREREAKRAAEAAEHGITAGDVVRVTRGGVGTQVPVGTVCVIEDVSGVFLYTTHDGARHILWAADVEPVTELHDEGLVGDEPDPIPESRIDEVPAAVDQLQIGDDVLTPGSGAGVVEHVDLLRAAVPA